MCVGFSQSLSSVESFRLLFEDGLLLGFLVEERLDDGEVGADFEGVLFLTWLLKEKCVSARLCGSGFSLLCTSPCSPLGAVQPDVGCPTSLGAKAAGGVIAGAYQQDEKK